jgi:hypothetical protein
VVSSPPRLVARLGLDERVDTYEVVRVARSIPTWSVNIVCCAGTEDSGGPIPAKLGLHWLLSFTSVSYSEQKEEIQTNRLTEIGWVV